MLFESRTLYTSNGLVPIFVVIFKYLFDEREVKFGSVKLS